MRVGRATRAVTQAEYGFVGRLRRGKDALANRNDSKLSSTKEPSKIHFDISDGCNA
jgi:hypothetical protein